MNIRTQLVATAALTIGLAGGAHAGLVGNNPAGLFDAIAPTTASTNVVPGGGTNFVSMVFGAAQINGDGITHPAMWVIRNNGTVQGNRCNGGLKDKAAFTSKVGTVAAVSDDGRVLVTDTTAGVEVWQIQPNFAGSGRPCWGLLDVDPVTGGIQGLLNLDSAVEIETLANFQYLIRGELGGVGEAVLVSAP
jgi:hypothetical protein